MLTSTRASALSTFLAAILRVTLQHTLAADCSIRQSGSRVFSVQHKVERTMAEQHAA